MKSAVLKSSFVASTLGIVHPNLSSSLPISRGRVRSHSFPQLQLPTNNRCFVHIEAVITDGPPLAVVQEFHAALGRGIETHEFNVRDTADNLVRLTRAVNDARILEKMFAFGTFRTVVRLFDAVWTVFRAISAFFRIRISELTLFAVSHTWTHIPGSVQKLALVTERAVFWRSAAFLAVRTTLATASIDRAYEEPGGTVGQAVTWPIRALADHACVFSMVTIFSAPTDMLTSN